MPSGKQCRSDSAETFCYCRWDYTERSPSLLLCDRCTVATAAAMDSADLFTLAHLPVEILSRILYFTAESPQFLLINVLPVCRSFEPAIFTAKLWRNLRLTRKALEDADRLRNLRCLLARVAKWVESLTLVVVPFPLPPLPLLPLMSSVESLKIERGWMDPATMAHLVEQTPSVTTAVIGCKVSE